MQDNANYHHWNMTVCVCLSVFSHIGGVVQQIGVMIVLFDDTSMKFCV